MPKKGNTQKAIKVLWIVMFLNFAVALFKIIVGTAANSGSIVADGYHSLSDGSGNIVGIIGLSIAGKPVDTSHPYGHKKFETLASLMIGVLLFAVACKVAYSAILGIMSPQMPEIGILSFVVMMTTLVVNIGVTRYEHKKGVQLKSDVLVSDAKQTKSDILITSGVILTMAFIKLGMPPVIDGVVSLLISGFIFKASYDVFSSSSQVLADASAIDSKEIELLVMTYVGVLGCHNVRSRGREDDIFVDLHIMVEPSMNVEEVHGLTHGVEALIKSKFGESVSVIIHIEPYKE